MKTPKIPSLQHLCRIWRDDPQKTAKELTGLVDNPPPFNYNPLYTAVRDGVRLGLPFSTLETYLKGKDRRDFVRKQYLEILPLVWSYFQERSPKFLFEEDAKYYPVGKNLMIPFHPPFVFSDGTDFEIPWFSFWRSGSLRDQRLSLFVTVVNEILKEQPDLELCHLRILDMSVASGAKTRSLKVLDGSDIELLSYAEMQRMLDIFAEGYRLACLTLASRSEEATRSPHRDGGDDGQGSLF